MKIQFLTSDISKTMGQTNLKKFRVSRISCRTFSESFKKIHFLNSRFDRESAAYNIPILYRCEGQNGYWPFPPPSTAHHPPSPFISHTFYFTISTSFWRGYIPPPPSTPPSLHPPLSKPSTYPPSTDPTTYPSTFNLSLIDILLSIFFRFCLYFYEVVLHLEQLSILIVGYCYDSPHHLLLPLEGIEKDAEKITNS